VLTFHDTLKVLDINDPNIVDRLQPLGFNNKNVKAATEAVKLLLVVRNAIDKVRSLAMAQERSSARQKPAGATDSGSGHPAAGGKPVRADGSDEAIACISVKFQQIDKDSHKDWIQLPPACGLPKWWRWSSKC
jgi:hypothetical protein